MRLKNLIYIGLCAVMLYSCGTLTKQHSRAEVQSAQRALSPENSITYLYTEGIKNAMMGGDPKQSEKLYLAALKIDPNHAPSLFELANIYALSAHDTALYLSKKAFALDTTNMTYRSQLGRLMIENGQYDSALTIYSSMLKLAPKKPDNYRLLAALYETLNQPFSAISILDSAEMRLGIQPELSGYKRQLLIGVKLYDKAINEALAMVNNFPYDENNYLVLAELYASTGKDSLSLDAYRTAMAINPDNVGVVASLNDYYKQKRDNIGFLSTSKQLFQSDYIDAKTKVEFFNDITKSTVYYRENYPQINDLASTLAIKYPNHYDVVKLYAKHLTASGSIEDALKLYKSHVTDTVSNFDAISNVIDIEAYLQRPDSVNKYSTIAIANFPQNPDLYIRKGSVMSFFLKDYKGAEKEFSKALKYAQSDSLKSVIYGIMGDNRHTMGDSKECYKLYELGIKADSTNAVIFNNYGYFLGEQNTQLDYAEKLTRKANELTGNSNPTYLDSYAWVLYKLGRHDEAAKIMRKAVSLDSTSSQELFFHYGEILHATGDDFMASVYWKKAKDNGYDPVIIEQRLKQIEK